MRSIRNLGVKTATGPAGRIPISDRGEIVLKVRKNKHVYKVRSRKDHHGVDLADHAILPVQFVGASEDDKAIKW